MNTIKFFKKKILLCINFIISRRIIYFSVFFYKRFLESKLDEAIGKYHLSLIKNKGINCRFHGKVSVYYDDGLNLGNHVRIGFNSFIFAMGGVTIGDNTQISRNVTIYSANHNVDGNLIPYDDSYICKPVIIGNSVWIGMNAQILPGVTIGDGAIIAMGAIITKDVKAGEVVVSNSQRVVKNRNMHRFIEKKEQELYFAKIWPQK